MPPGLSGEVGGGEAVANLGVARESSGAAARDVGEDEVEVAECSGWIGGVGGLSGDALGVGVLLETGAHGGEAARAHVGGEDLRVREAVGEDEGFAAGGGAGVPEAGGLRICQGDQFGYEAGAVVDLRELGFGG